MDIWAWCERCDRWFGCPTWFDITEPEPTCPDCGLEPSAICNRAAYRVVVDPAA